MSCVDACGAVIGFVCVAGCDVCVWFVHKLCCRVWSRIVVLVYCIGMCVDVCWYAYGCVVLLHVDCVGCLVVVLYCIG